MTTDEITLIENLENWVINVVDGFTEYLYDVETPEDVCLHCLCDHWCNENVTSLLYDANQIAKVDPDLAIDYLIEKREINKVIADTLIGNLIVALTEMHRPERLEAEDKAPTPPVEN